MFYICTYIPFNNFRVCALFNAIYMDFRVFFAICDLRFPIFICFKFV